jgi:hypothetical protein
MPVYHSDDQFHYTNWRIPDTNYPYAFTDSDLYPLELDVMKHSRIGIEPMLLNPIILFIGFF